MKSDIFLRQWWHDERLDVKDRVLNFGIDPTDHFWVPDTFISNSRKTESHKTFTKSVKTTIGPKDSVYASMRYAVCQRMKQSTSRCSFKGVGSRNCKQTCYTPSFQCLGTFYPGDFPSEKNWSKISI